MIPQHVPYKTDFKFGATLLGDAGFDTSWASRLHSVIGAAVSSKTANREFEKLLLKNKDKLIYRPVLTGFGGTELEPGVPKPEKILEQVREIVEKGFPTSHVTLYVSPIFPVDWVPYIKETFGIDYLEMLHYILDEAKSIGITKVFQGFFDMDYLTMTVLRRFDERLFINPYEWHFDEFKEISLKVMEPSLEYVTNDPFYPFARLTGIADNEDLKTLKLDRVYRFANPFDYVKNILELIVNPAKDCPGKCKICHLGNEFKYSPIEGRWILPEK